MPRATFIKPSRPQKILATIFTTAARHLSTAFFTNLRLTVKGSTFKSVSR